MSLQWTKISCPARCSSSCCPGRYTSPIASITNTEFVLAEHHNEFKGLCTCNAETNQWDRIEIKYPENFKLGIHSIAVDSATNTVFICNTKQLISINMKNNDISQQQSKVLATFNFDRVGQIFFIPELNQIHIINFSEHLIFHLNSSQKEPVTTVSNIFGNTATNSEESNDSAGNDVAGQTLYLDPGSMIYIKSRQSIMGRSMKIVYDDIESVHILNSIAEYSLLTQQWTHHKEWIPLRLVGRVARSVITKSEDYIFSIGFQEWLQHTNELVDVNHMLIYDVKANDFKMSVSELPSKELSFITMTNNENKDKSLVDGYVGDELPVDVVSCIRNWVCFEKIHFIADNDVNSMVDHWTIDVDEVLETKEDIKMLSD